MKCDNNLIRIDLKLKQMLKHMFTFQFDKLC